MTAEEWAGKVKICLRRLELGEQPPHSVTDHPAQFAAIVEVIRAAVATEREECARALLVLKEDMRARSEVSVAEAAAAIAWNAALDEGADAIRARGQQP